MRHLMQGYYSMVFQRPAHAMTSFHAISHDVMWLQAYAYDTVCMHVTLCEVVVNHVLLLVGSPPFNRGTGG